MYRPSLGAGSELPPSKPPSRRLEGSGDEAGERDEGLKVEEAFTFGRLKESFKETSREVQGSLKGLEKTSPSEGFKGA